MAKLTKPKALALARVKLGKGAYLQDSGRKFGPSSEALRQAAQKALAELVAQEPKINQLKDWPRNTPLGEYHDAVIAHRKAWNEWKWRKDKLFSQTFYQRYDVGKSDGMFNWIKGSGDTWEEALQKAGVPLPVKGKKIKVAPAKHEEKHGEDED